MSSPSQPQETTPPIEIGQTKTPQVISPEDAALLRQGVNQDELRAVQEGIVNPPRSVENSVPARYPGWPTSVPGPRATPPPPGMRPFNAIRPEQVAEVGYNQETGEPITDDPHRILPDASQGPSSLDLPTAQEAHKRGKTRL